jgi:ActR/RegA family two-component response regulator
MNIGDWMETPSGGKIVGYAFGFGAAVVIIGALFKIQHWPFASAILTAGMGTEALLFAITAFGKPHKTYHWDSVFPQLKDDAETMDGIAQFGGYAGAGNVAGESGFSGGSNLGGIAGVNLEGVPTISEDDIKKLSSGITKLSETAHQLAGLTSAKDATMDFVKNLTAASNSVVTYVSAQNEINFYSSSLIDSYKNIASNVSAVSDSSKNYIDEMNNVNKNLSSINALYELQMKEVELQKNAVQTVSGEWNKTQLAAAQALKETELYTSEVARLTKQVVDLNGIYGNMLNAASIK